MLAHLCALSGFIVPFGSLLGPFIIWQIKKNEFPSVEGHAKSALNFQISCLIYVLCCIPLIFVFGIGALLMGAVAIGSLACVIIATIKSNNGEAWKYPLSITFLK